MSNTLAIVMFLALLGFIFWLSHRRPLWGLWSVVISEFLLHPRPEISGIFVRLSDLAVLGLILAIAVRFSTNRFHLRDRLSMDGTLSYALLAILTTSVISTVFAINLTPAIRETIQVIELMLLVSLTGFVATDRASKRSVIILVLGMTFVEAILGSIQYVTNLGDVYLTGGLVRASGTLENDLAGYLVIGVAAGLAVAISSERRPGLILAQFATSLITAVLVLTQVRGAWISAGLIFVAALTLYWRWWKRIVVVLIMASLLVSGLWAAQEAIAPRFRQPGIQSGFGTGAFISTLEMRGLRTVSARLLMWEAAFNMWRRHILVGVGPGNYGVLLTKPSITEIDLRDLVRVYNLSPKTDAHSGFFTQLAEVGLLGTLASLWLLSTSVLRCWSLYRRDLGLSFSAIREQSATGGRSPEVWAVAVILIVFVSFPAFFYSGLPGGKLFWIILGMLVGRNTKPSHKEPLHVTG